MVPDAAKAGTDIQNMRRNFDRAAKGDSNIDIDKQMKAPHSPVAASGEVIDQSLKTINSIADMHDARRSGDVQRQFDAETAAMRETLKTGVTSLENLVRDQQGRGAPGTGAGDSLGQQAARAFNLGDKIIGGAQVASKGADAYFDARDGNYKAAYENGKDAVQNFAETFTKYGKNTESFFKAGEALVRANNSTDSWERVKATLEYAGHGVRVGQGIVPGAKDAGGALLSARDTVQDVQDYQYFRDLGNRRPAWRRLDEFGRSYRENIEILDQLERWTAPTAPPIRLP
jgi:hypothetical protein